MSASDWPARRQAAIEAAALAALGDAAASPATRAAARAELVAPSPAEVMRRYDAALAAMSLAELGALRRALRALASAQGLDPIAAALSGGPSTRALLRELGADQAPDQGDQERELARSGAEQAPAGSD